MIGLIELIDKLNYELAEAIGLTLLDIRFFFYTHRCFPAFLLQLGSLLHEHLRC